MAKKIFDQTSFKRGREIPDFDNPDYNPDEHTYNVIEDFENKPTKEKLPVVIKAIKDDSKLSPLHKDQLLQRLREDFVSLFNFDNLPEDYESLKNEAKILADLTQSAFVLMAQRLKKIRDNELYREGGYSDFKAFIENELSINRTTAYNYIDLINVFGVQALEHRGIEPSKLIPTLPLLKNNPDAKLRKEFLSDSKTLSFRAMVEKVKRIKNKDNPASESKKPKSKKGVSGSEQFDIGELLEIRRAIDLAIDTAFYKASKKERARLDKVRKKIAVYLKSSK